MYIQKMEYHSPKRLPDLLDMLKKYGEDAKILAGGTDLILQMKLKKWKQRHLVDIKRIPGFNTITYENNNMTIGCNTTLSHLLDSDEIKRNYKALWDSIYELADIQIRNRGTLVGNVCNASPAADTSSPLLAYGAKVVAMSTREEREISLEDFFVGPGKTALRSDEFISQIYIPKPPAHSYCSFQKIGRVYDDIAIINAAVQVQFDNDLKCKTVTIAMGAVGPTTRRAVQAEDLLKENKLETTLIHEAAIQAAEESTPITDVRASAEYRKKVVGVLVERALHDIMNKTKKGS